MANCSCLLNLISSYSNMLGRTGTFCAIFTVLEQFKVDQVVDVLQTVKLLRIKRPGIIEDLVSSLSCSDVDTRCIHAHYNDLTTMHVLFSGSVPVYLHCCGTVSTIIWHL